MLCQYTQYKLQRTINLKSVGLALNLGYLFQILQIGNGTMPLSHAQVGSAMENLMYSF